MTQLAVMKDTKPMWDRRDIAFEKGRCRTAIKEISRGISATAHGILVPTQRPKRTPIEVERLEVHSFAGTSVAASEVYPKIMASRSGLGVYPELKKRIPSNQGTMG
jgi:hypothetical protein